MGSPKWDSLGAQQAEGQREPSGVLLSREVPVLAQTKDVLNCNSHGDKNQGGNGRRAAKTAVTGGGRKGQ